MTVITHLFLVVAAPPIGAGMLAAMLIEDRNTHPATEMADAIRPLTPTES